MKNILNYFKKDPEADFEHGPSLNEANSKRNWLIAGTALTLLGGVYLAGDYYMSVPKRVQEDINHQIDFGAVIDTDFTEKDNQSALTAQQIALDKQQRDIDKLLKTVEGIERNNEANRLDLKRNLDSFQQVVTEKFDERIAGLTLDGQGVNGDEATYDSNEFIDNEVDATAYSGRQSTRYLGEQRLPDRPSIGDGQGYSAPYQGGAIAPPATQNGIDSFTLNWDTPEQHLPKKRTTENYVPAGSFVTAIVTGGADANAGVNGQGDTVPMVFQTINEGVLPNGQPSKLKNCTILGAAYGEISSSRGIVRTTRLSCIFEDEIIDTGIGETGKSLSETTSNSALGSTSSVNGSDALLNLAGNATSSIGSKLADYYIKLAEQYHPIIELNPGNTVNIVFLKGFPLDPVGIQEYEEALAQQAQVPVSATAQILNTISNPLMEQMPGNIQPKGQGANAPTPQQQYNQQAQRPPVNSAFGRAN
jgi:conjugal transfer pilus assembly protein TraB